MLYGPAIDKSMPNILWILTTKRMCRLSTFLITGLLMLNPSLSFCQLSAYQLKQIVESPQVESKLASLSIGDLWILRNYIFAKHGYNFKNTDLSWYYAESYGFEPNKGNINEKLSQEEKELVKLIRAEEEKKKLANRKFRIGEDEFRLKNGKLYLPQGIISDPISDEAYQFISYTDLSEELYIVNIESAYFIGDVECCGAIGAKNKVIRQFLFYPKIRKWVEVPKEIYMDSFIDNLIEDKYLFVLNHIFSGAHTLRIYDKDSFQLLTEIEQIEHFEGLQEEEKGLPIWTILTEQVEYPYIYRQLYYFKKGQITKTDKIEKVKAEWYFAG